MPHDHTPPKARNRIECPGCTRLTPLYVYEKQLPYFACGYCPIMGWITGTAVVWVERKPFDEAKVGIQMQEGSLIKKEQSH